MLIFAVLLALLLGWCTGGRLSRFEEAKLRFLLLPPLALFLQAVPGRFSAAHYERWGWVLILCSYLLLFFFLWKNRHLKKTAIMLGMGSLCNLAAIAANGWRMPVAQNAAALLSPEGLAALSSRSLPMYALADTHTRLGFLGDIIYFPLPFLRGFASIGDLLLAAGVLLCLLAVMAPPKLPRWLRSG